MHLAIWICIFIVYFVLLHITRQNSYLRHQNYFILYCHYHSRHVSVSKQKRSSNRSRIFWSKWISWISFFVNRWCVEEIKLDWRFLNHLVTQIVLFSLATMFRDLFSVCHFLDLNKEQEIWKKRYFYLN